MHASTHAAPCSLPNPSKAFLLAYDSGLRVVVHTANLLEGDVHQKTQALFCQARTTAKFPGPWEGAGADGVSRLWRGVAPATAERMHAGANGLLLVSAAAGGLSRQPPRTGSPCHRHRLALLVPTSSAFS
jgi:hypothetical protein